jgi:transcriptional regulator with XRE-family HTH domain
MVRRVGHPTHSKIFSSKRAASAWVKEVEKVCSSSVVTSLESSMSVINENLKIARKNAGYTQQQVAAALGITRGAVALWEAKTDHAVTPRPHTLVKLAKFYGVNLDTLTGSPLLQTAPTSAKKYNSDKNEPYGALPDFQMDNHIFVFAESEEQVVEKFKALKMKSNGLHKHLVLIGSEASVHSVKTRQEAMSFAVNFLVTARQET